MIFNHRTSVIQLLFIYAPVKHCRKCYFISIKMYICKARDFICLIIWESAVLRNYIDPNLSVRNGSS